MMGYSPLALWLLVSLCAFVPVSAESNATADASTPVRQQTLVGWVAGPTQRGTLALVYGCLSTIFASTWTVLHLNVPGQDEKGWQKALRKAKWMAITVLFPEFIFSKAVYELRTAVADLCDMHVAMVKSRHRLRWKGTAQLPWRQEVTLTRTWGTHFGPGMRLLYRLCGLGIPPAVAVEVGCIWNGMYWVSPATYEESYERDNAPREDEGLAYKPEVISSVLSEELRFFGGNVTPCPIPYAGRLDVQRWTLVHSFYANMGGLVYIDQDACTHPVTASVLAYAVRMQTRSMACLEGLALSRDDIEDKSNADWLLKAIAITQITWIVLNVAARAAANLPVTQLEIATAGFSLMAVATYAASWWKPKDVSKPTVVGRLPHVYSFLTGKKSYRSVVGSIWTPSERQSALHWRQNRIPNDSICQDTHEQTPRVFLILLTVSSMVFGGFHCLAWNLQFPSAAEQLLWRVASTTSAALPGVLLAIVSLLSYCAATVAENRHLAAVLDTLAPLHSFPPEWWDLLAQRPSFLDWPWQSWYAFRTRFSQHPSDALDWGEQPTVTEEIPPDAAIAHNDRHALETSWQNLNRFRQSWLEVKRGVIRRQGDQPEFLKLYHAIHDEDTKRRARNIELAAQHWRAYEAYLRTKLPNLAPELRTVCVRDVLAITYHPLNALRRKRWDFEDRCDWASRSVTICGSIVYAASRLVILVLLFTSLRSVPEDVYADTPWTRFLPNIS